MLLTGLATTITFRVLTFTSIHALLCYVVEEKKVKFVIEITAIHRNKEFRFCEFIPFNNK